MAELKQIALDKTTVTLHWLRGQVTGASKWSTTHVSGGGGGGGAGYSGNVQIRSTTTEHDQFFVRTVDGKETPVRLSDAQLAVREGHEVSLLWGTREGQGEGPFLAVVNHTTGSTDLIKPSIQRLAGKLISGPGAAVIIGVPIGTFLFFSANGLLGMISLGVGGWFFYKAYSAYRARQNALLAEVQGAAAQLSGRVA